MDEFKKHLRQHEHELDTEKPSSRVWQQVQLETGKQPAKFFAIKTWLKYAAVACVVLLVVIAVRYTNRETNPQEPIAKQADPLPVQPSDTTANPLIAVIDSPVIKPPVEKQRQPVIAPAKRPAKSIPVIDELEHSYGQLVNYQLNRIRQTPVYAEEQGYFNSFKDQFRQIEKDEAGVKKDIQQNGLSDILLDQMIEVYQQKLNVLKSFQTAIQKMNNRVQLQQRDSTTTKHYYITL
jgi:hypothetical protein